MSEFDEARERDLVEITNDQGDSLTMEVLDYFYYNGEEYVVLADASGKDEDEEEVSCYVMHVSVSEAENGDEMEEFEPVEDMELESRLIEVATSRFSTDEDDEDVEDDIGDLRDEEI